MKAMVDPTWVLVAEDDDTIRQLICDSLTSAGEDLNLKVVEARDGLEAITKARLKEFHCVVTDLRMPRSTGEDFIRDMQTNSLNANTPTLVITGHGSDEFSERYSHIRVIAKPFIPNDLAKRVIREVKLGRIDDRIAIHLINPFSMAIKNLFETDFAIQLKMDEPVVKRSGEAVVGDVHCTLSLQTGNSKSRFTVSFDKSMIEHLKTLPFLKKAMSGSFTADLATRHLCQGIFENVAPILKNQLGQTPRLIATSILTSPAEIENSDLVRGHGVYLSMRTDQGRIIAGAFSKVRSRN